MSMKYFPTHIDDIGIYQNFVFYAINLWQEVIGRYDLLLEAYATAEKCADPYVDGEFDIWGGNRYVFPIQNEILISCSVIIILIHSGLDGYLTNYGTRKLGNSYMEKIDKIGFIEKFIMLPHLVTGKEVSRSTIAYQLMTQLNTDRNFLIHNKSKSLLRYDEKSKTYIPSTSAIKWQEFFDSLVDKANDAIKCIHEFSLLMVSMDPKENPPVAQFGFFDTNLLLFMDLERKIYFQATDYIIKKKRT